MLKQCSKSDVQLHGSFQNSNISVIPEQVIHLNNFAWNLHSRNKVVLSQSMVLLLLVWFTSLSVSTLLIGRSTYPIYTTWPDSSRIKHQIHMIYTKSFFIFSYSWFFHSIFLHRHHYYWYPHWAAILIVAWSSSWLSSCSMPPLPLPFPLKYSPHALKFCHLCIASIFDCIVKVMAISLHGHHQEEIFHHGHWALRGVVPWRSSWPTMGPWE